MTPQEELDLALAELAAAEAELAAIKANTTRTKRPTISRPKRQVHRSDLRSERYGYGGHAPMSRKLRLDMTPVITKELDPTDRPTRDRMPRKVSVRVYNDAGQQQGLAMTITERESDRLEADLPFGWTITSRKIA